MEQIKTSKSLYDVMKERRSIRVLGKKENISQEALEQVINQALTLTPTAFHAREQRLVLLVGQRHTWFWKLIGEKLKEKLSPEKFPETVQKLKGFQGGVGTILFYQDTKVTKALQERFPTYKENFPHWAREASGMLKYTLWTSLVAEGYGVSLQHYTELIEEEVNTSLQIDPSWKMVGQMPFGEPKEIPGEKDERPIPGQFLVFSGT